MKKVKVKIFDVTLNYKIEADGAAKAIDDVLAKHPLQPVGISCELISDEDANEQ